MRKEKGRNALGINSRNNQTPFRWKNAMKKHPRLLRAIVSPVQLCLPNSGLPLCLPDLYHSVSHLPLCFPNLTHVVSIQFNFKTSTYCIWNGYPTFWWPLRHGDAVLNRGRPKAHRSSRRRRACPGTASGQHVAIHLRTSFAPVKQTLRLCLEHFLDIGSRMLEVETRQYVK